MPDDDLLFHTPPSLSPRLAWMQQHGILTHRSERAPAERRFMALLPLTEDLGLTIPDCLARHARLYEERGRIGYGADEETALRDLAINSGLRLWNEGSAITPA